MTTLINHFGKSPLASQIELGAKSSNKSTAKTRWSSQIVLLKQFLEAEQTVVAIARAKGIDLPTRREFQFLHQIYSLMKIFIDVLQRMQAEKTVTISLGYGYLKIFSKSISKFKEKFPTSCELANGLQEIMNKRFQCFMNANCLEFDPIFMVAALLDPNTAFQLTDKDYLIALSSVKNMIQIRQPESNENLPENRLLDATLDQLMAEYAMEQRSRRKQKEPDGGHVWLSQILQRVVGMNSFGKSKIDALKYWSSLIYTDPRPVAKLALEVLSVPISSAPIERIFSQAGLATASHRNRTNFDLLNSQLFIYCNRHI